MKKWIIEFVLYSVYMVFGAAWATTGAVMPQIMSDFNVDVSHAALMSNVILWAKIVGAVWEGANKQVISSQADSLIKISRIWADFFPANTSNQPI
ncbi:hypothetical protein [Escherichia coli]|uniref:hypothetical protein n=1 Tax=Escherichia coli TaxID=562 RepID=UPI0020202133|nr:hypothetical protein [Escherichia coli]MCL7906739.1 hypothetical protein [Escherichia coli]MCL7916718.1 hypothetical protein [Escherichia coli]